MSKEEKKRKEEENLKTLKNITSKECLLSSLQPLQKAKGYENIISNLETEIKYFPESDQNEKYYKRYIQKIDEIGEKASEIYMNEKRLKECISIDKKLLKYNNKNDKAIVRLYKNYWDIGDKETAVIYGSFLYLRCDKKTQDKYKQLIPEIKNNFRIVATEFQNRSILRDIKFDRKMILRFIFFIISIIYIVKNFKDIKSIF